MCLGSIEAMTEFELSTDQGALSATLNVPESPNCVLLLAHGAGADHKHVHMESLSCAFANVGIATLRFNFPFKQKGGTRVDSTDVSVSCIVSAAEELKQRIDLPLFIGGHSFGGRMATHAAAGKLVECRGLVLCSFPLHPAGKPGIKRAAHFSNINVPVLFLSGDRDKLAEPALLEAQLPVLKNAQLHWLSTADHSFKILKRTRLLEIDVYQEAAEAAATFTNTLL